MVTTQNFVKGETILKQGSVGDRSYKILLGEVVVCVLNDEGQHVPVAKLTRGDMFGEMYLFHNKGYRSASVIAATDIQVEVYFRDELEGHLRQLPLDVQTMVEGLSSRLKNVSHSFSNLRRRPDGKKRVRRYAFVRSGGESF
ncbi:MAG: cyclic nucleotide-binding domain-containing protein [Candidatus Melainabacteria bacterium]|nr:cyclic nucleotide-binding domain-containing protein [Candidatus Melainabacteria bacterium]